MSTATTPVLTEAQVAKAVAILRPHWPAICEAERRAAAARAAAGTTEPAETTA